MSKYDKSCTICGRQYQYCSSCAKYSSYPRWMTAYCSEECKTIFTTIMDYRVGKLTKPEAAEILRKIDVNKIAEQGMKKFADEILSEDPVVVVPQETAQVKVEIQEEVNEEKPVESHEEKPEQPIITYHPAEEKSDVASEPVEEKTEEKSERPKTWKRRFSGYRKTNHNNNG